MNIFSVLRVFRTSRRLRGAALLLLVATIAFVGHDRFIAAPERRAVICRYDEFRAVVALGDATRILQLVAPEFRTWADSRLHLYQNFARPLNECGTVSVFFREATICPEPGARFLFFRGGHVLTMIKHEGEWFMGRVFID
jgi:hypothetical protein